MQLQINAFFQLYYDGDMDFLENITSCGKVENCVVLSEFEANLSKEGDQNGGGPRCSKGEVCSECHGEVVRQPQVVIVLFCEQKDMMHWVKLKRFLGCLNPVFEQCAILQSESRRGSAISLFLSGRKKKWPSLFGGKKRRGRADDDGYGSEMASDVRLKEFDQVNT